ncbi:MAG: hypothetical protein DRG78_09425 [Epsilonproteobacteria bacterium]|nr:MAG: hypothetical protein DRG78_09425 [Campylobacterota bacterium]
MSLDYFEIKKLKVNVVCPYCRKHYKKRLKIDTRDKDKIFYKYCDNCLITIKNNSFDFNESSSLVNKKHVENFITEFKISDMKLIPR